MTAQEILEKVESLEISIEDFAYGEFDSIEIGLGEFETVERYGGEDQGTKWFRIKYFKDHDVYIKTDGYYTSYDGTYFDEGYGYEVSPVEKIVKVFEKVNK